MKKRKAKSKETRKKQTLSDLARLKEGFALEDKKKHDRDNVEKTSLKSESRKRIFATPSHSTLKKEKTLFTHGSTFTLSSNQSYSHSTKHRKSSTVRKKRQANKNTTMKMKSNVRNHIVCSISENLARETCVSSLDAGLPIEMQVTKQANGKTYIETLNYLEILRPDEILLNEGRRNSPLARKIVKKYKDENSLEEDDASHNNATLECKSTSVIKFLPRYYFDQTRGAELLRKICLEDTYNATMLEEYIILASSHAVLQYAQVCLGATFAKNCIFLKIEASGRDRMSIDRASVHHLELLNNAKTGKVQHSLVGTVDCTKTSVGARLLRTNLLAPPMKIQTTEARLDLVDSFMEDEDFFYSVLEHLETLPDVDKMLSHLTLVPKTKNKSQDILNSDRPLITSRIASKGISALVCIKSTLSSIPSFASVIESQLQKLELIEMSSLEQEQAKEQRNSNLDNEISSSFITPKGTSRSESDNSQEIFSKGAQNLQLLRAILATMKQAALTEVLAAVTNIFTPSTAYSRNSHAMRHQECFALKPNTDGMMDVLRKAYLANVDDIYRLADEYAESLGINVLVKETNARGYYLCVPNSLASELPPILIQPVKSGRFIHCTTEEILSLNSRAQENVQDLLIMTHNRIQEVLNIARERYDCLAALSDSIALIDMCHCFADNVVSSRLPWCRPIMTDHLDGAGSGAMSIRNGRYGIDLSSTGLEGNKGFIPNDTFASSVQNFTIITGINGSGKSTYLKQLAIIVILAQCGCYVPAEEASIPIRDKICTRIGSSDDQEHNISSFMLEMKETATICANATNKSLILIDELGRATSNEDGVAIAWAISEFLLVKRSMTFFVTHYTQLSNLIKYYPNVQNQHMSSTTNGDNLMYTHKIMPGSCKMASDYGVEMAQLCGWPIEIVEELPDAALCCEGYGSNTDNNGIQRKAEHAMHDLAKHLVALKESEGILSVGALRPYLQDIHDKIAPSTNLEVIKKMKELLNIEEESPTAKRNNSRMNKLNQIFEIATTDVITSCQEENENKLQNVIAYSRKKDVNEMKFTDQNHANTDQECKEESSASFTRTMVSNTIKDPKYGSNTSSSSSLSSSSLSSTSSESISTSESSSTSKF